MRKLAFILLVVMSLSFAACFSVPYTKYEPQAVTDNPIGSKIGKAPVSVTGIQEAANSAGITRIATVDIVEEFDGKKTTYMYIVSGE